MTQHSFQALLVQASDFKCKLDERTPQFDGVCIARETQRCSNNVVWVGLIPQPRLQGWARDPVMAKWSSESPDTLLGRDRDIMMHVKSISSLDQL